MLVRNGARRIAALAIGMSVLSTGCASMFNSGTQTTALVPQFSQGKEKEKIRVEIRTSSGISQTTIPGPITYYPSSFGTPRITVVEACFEHTETTIPHSIAPSYWLNFPGLLIIVGWVGFPLDLLDGYALRYDTSASVPVTPVSDFDACIAKAGAVK